MGGVQCDIWPSNITYGLHHSPVPPGAPYLKFRLPSMFAGTASRIVNPAWTAAPCRPDGTTAFETFDRPCQSALTFRLQVRCIAWWGAATVMPWLHYCSPTLLHDVVMLQESIGSCIPKACNPAGVSTAAASACPAVISTCCIPAAVHMLLVRQTIQGAQAVAHPHARHTHAVKPLPYIAKHVTR